MQERHRLSASAALGVQVYQGGETTDGRRIYVGNINYDFREEEIRQKFNEVRLCRVSVRAERTGIVW